MKGLVTLLAFPLVFAACSSHQPVATPGQYACAFDKTITKNVKCNYLLYLPGAYGTRTTQEWPLMVFLHGSGERGGSIDKVKKQGPPKLIAEGRQYPYIVLSPQCPSGEWWSADLLMPLIDEIIATYRVDTNRIYLTGLSMGGFGAWRLAGEYPWKWAAVVPICGGGNPNDAWRMRRLPFWVFHGAQDNVVPIAESQTMVDALKKRGADVQFTIYPDAKHDAWTATYTNDALYAWLDEHRTAGGKSR
ncbi:prolyl oligopeptidase family serine peptidase [bacterium]|nr:prolyl oligopeptidase family serine peptidase [bacterium]